MNSETGSSLRSTDVQDRRLSIFDVSSADDSLLDPLPAFPLNHDHLENQEREDLLYTPNSKKFEDAARKIEEWEREPRTNETSEAEKPKKNSKCNLRKSLAWDSAFFTSAGVLDAEELSSIIEGVEKEEKHALPGIQEDVYKSCDSISTLESDCLTLEVESLEGDLFEDVRASIQKSSNKKSSFAIGNSKELSGVAGFHTDDSSKRVGMASRNKMKAPLASKNPSAGIQGSGKMTKKNPIFPQFPQKPDTTRRESSVLKQSKIPGKPSPSSTISSKRVSLGDLHVKIEKDKAKRTIGDRVSALSKASAVGGSRRTVSKYTLSSKSPSGPPVSTKTKLATSTSAAARKPPSSCSTVRTPSRIISTNKTESGNSSLSSLISVTKLSSSISPASSISDWSSESSSSASMAKHMCNSSLTSIDSISSKKIFSEADADKGANSHNPMSDSSLEGLEIQHTGFINSSARTAPGGTVLPPALMRPSGLRLPSPKIGFFDGAKPSVRTPRQGMQPRSAVPRVLPKHGARSPCEGQNKAKLGKLQPARPIISVEDTKPNDQQDSLPIPLQASKTSLALQNFKSSSDIPKEVQNETHLKTGEGAVENVENKVLRFFELDLTKHPLKGVNNKETVIDQVDCLSKQVGRMDINFETPREKVNGDFLSSCQNNTSFQDKPNSMELSSHKELLDCPKMEGLTRSPFSVKDSFYNMEDR